MWVTSSPTTVLTPTAVALGNFDGVHLGHRQVIQPVHSIQSLPGARFLYPTVVTFHPHPKEFFTGQPRRLLTPLSEKVAQLKAIGVEQLVRLPFDRELANLEPDEFVREVLVRRLRAVHVSVGLDFCFGRERAGDAKDLRAIAAQHGIEVTITPLELLNGQRISSTAIRQALQQGELQLANRLLGRPYRFVGQVVKGQQLGRTLGFPTANLDLPPDKFIPQTGVYAVRVAVCESDSSNSPLMATQVPGVMNVGYRPTVDGTRQTIEVHLLDWTGDLYGRVLLVDLERFLRAEQKFASLEELTAQIQADCEAARALLVTTSDESGVAP